jgi:hypothetical protein
LGASTCNINFSWTTTNPVATSAVTKPINITVGSGNSGTNVPFVIKWGGDTFYLYNNAVLLAQSTVASSSVTCVSGTGWNGSVCATSVNGTSGNANGKTYPNGTTGYGSDTQCTTGTSSNTAFPSAGSSVSWMCLGSNGGIDGGPYSASQVALAVINGSCATTHFNCSAGTSANNAGSTSAWTWSCNGSGGGTNASCSQLKQKPGYKEN